MAVTTPAQEYARLRSYLNPYIKGPNTTAVLQALATGSSAYLVNNAAAVNDQLYVITASGQYLDQRLADYGIVRPPNVGLPDSIFRQIGIEVKNRKQVRDLINNILDTMFGDEYTKAISKASEVEPYALEDGDTLIINFDENHTATIIFHAENFANINAALAIEVADAITIALRNFGYSGVAIANNDGNGNYVELISNTIGPTSSITVLGGSAQNELLFDSILPAGGNSSTQWTISLQAGAPGGVIRFTWTGGANPNLGRVEEGDYVNIFGGGFASSANEGSYTILSSVGGAIGNSYFEVQNPFGTSGIVVQGTNDAILFFDPVRRQLNSQQYYAAVYQTQSRILQIFLPATTQVIGRTRLGTAFLHEPPYETYLFVTNPNPGDVFQITTANALVAGTDFVIAATVTQTILNFVNAVNLIDGLDAVPSISPAFENFLVFENGNYVLLENSLGNILVEASEGGNVSIFQDIPSITLVGTYTGSANISGSGPEGDPLSVQPNQPGPNTFDTTQPFTVSSINTVLTQELNANSPDVFTVANAVDFPNSPGLLIFNYGDDNQEGPVPYIARPSDNTLLLSPVYSIKTPHPPGTTVFLVSLNAPPVITPDGLNYPFYITDVVAGRIYAQDLIQSVAAAGISIVFTILYPNDIGLGKWGTPYSEITEVYGP
jgi:hypothetical protein